ncbi:hypothetical protein D3C85_921560 [compost metagenome]
MARLPLAAAVPPGATAAGGVAPAGCRGALRRIPLRRQVRRPAHRAGRRFQPGQPGGRRPGQRHPGRPAAQGRPGQGPGQVADRLRQWRRLGQPTGPERTGPVLLAGGAAGQAGRPAAIEGCLARAAPGIECRPRPQGPAARPAGAAPGQGRRRRRALGAERPAVASGRQQGGRPGPTGPETQRPPRPGPEPPRPALAETFRQGPGPPRPRRHPAGPTRHTGVERRTARTGR